MRCSGAVEEMSIVVGVVRVRGLGVWVLIFCFFAEEIIFFMIGTCKGSV